MRTAEFISIYAGILVGLGYLIGSVARSRASRNNTPPLAAIAVEVALPMIWAAISFAVIDRVAPGTSAFRNSSAVGFLSSKALTVWESVALWAGLSTLIGFIVPVTTGGRRGSTGLAGAAALLLTYSPMALLVSGGAFVAGSSMGRSTKAGVIAAAGSVAVSEWVLSILDFRAGWGFISGPETSLWAVVMAGSIAAATLRDGAGDDGGVDSVPDADR